MDSQEVLYRLMYRAFLEIREEAYTVQNKKIFHIADLFHTLPLELRLAGEQQRTYEDILHDLHVRAQEKGSEDWLTHAIEDESSGSASRKGAKTQRDGQDGRTPREGENAEILPFP